MTSGDHAACSAGARSWRRLAAGLVVGPVAFVVAWAVGGALMPQGYSPVTDAISRIAAVGSPQRWAMTAGFMAYGVAVAAGALGLHGTVVQRCGLVAVVNGLSTVAVAAAPLDRSDTVDLLHGLAATIGYLSITAIPLVAVAPLRTAGRARAATWSLAASAISATCLVATTVTDTSGLLQRLGLLSGDCWLVLTGLAVVTGRLDHPPRRPG